MFDPITAKLSFQKVQKFSLKIEQLPLLDIPFLHLSRELLPQLPELSDHLVDGDELDEKASALE